MRLIRFFFACMAKHSASPLCKVNVHNSQGSAFLVESGILDEFAGTFAVYLRQPLRTAARREISKSIQNRTDWGQDFVLSILRISCSLHNAVGAALRFTRPLLAASLFSDRFRRFRWHLLCRLLNRRHFGGQLLGYTLLRGSLRDHLSCSLSCGLF